MNQTGSDYFLLEGPAGSLTIQSADEVARKLAMLIEGKCLGLGPTKAAGKYGYTKQRFFQLLDAFEHGGSIALMSKKKGPKTNYRRTDNAVSQVIRYRFLDPDANAAVIAQKMKQTGIKISQRSVERVIADHGLQKKKLYQFRPKDEPQEIEIQYNKERTATVKVNSVAIERDVRQMLAEKISGTHVGLWLLLPEHLRLGSWDLLMAWSGVSSANRVDPRLALQVVHESALCLSGIRQKRSLRLKGFEALNGLPFVATDGAIHQLFDRHTVAEAEALQLALGKLRYVRGDYPGELLLLDPHRIQTWTQRNLPLNRAKKSAPTRKTIQTFFAIDGASGQPLGCGMGSSAVTITQATLPLVERLAAILPGQRLLIGDGEHFTVEMLDSLAGHRQFSFLFPIPKRKAIMQQIATLPFIPLWAGYAVAEWEYQLADKDKTIRAVVQRTGETQDSYDYKPFATTSQLPAADLMTLAFPERWNIEEFFNTESALGWKRAATLNMNIRFGKLAMGLIAQAVTYQLRQKLPPEMSTWTAESLAEKLFSSIDGDIRVRDDTIVVTFYNAPNYNYFKEHYQNLPKRLDAEGIDPRVPWLYNFKVNFRFK